MSFFSGKKIFLLGFMVILLVAVPLTVFLTQQTQKTTSSAAPATTLSFVPPTKTANVGDTVSFDISMDPGTNQVSFVKMNILYDATKLSADNSSLVPNPIAFQTAPLEGPTCNSGSCNITLSVGADPAKVIQGTRTKIATITFKATNPGTAQVSLPRASLQVLSIASADQASENVLASDPLAATVTIGGTAAPTATITAAPTETIPPSIITAAPTATIAAAPAEIIVAAPTAILTLPPSIITAAPIVIITVAPTAPPMVTGPGDKILGVGVAGIVFTILGGILFLAL